MLEIIKLIFVADKKTVFYHYVNLKEQDKYLMIYGDNYMNLLCKI